MTDSCHVVKLRGVKSCFRNREFTPLTTTIPPWDRVVVGSPKSKRGAHLKKGGSAYAARWGGDAGQSLESGPPIGAGEAAGASAPAQEGPLVPRTAAVVASTSVDVSELVYPIGPALELGAEYNTQKRALVRGASSSASQNVVATADVSGSHASARPLVPRTSDEGPLIVELSGQDRATGCIDDDVLDATAEELAVEVIDCDGVGVSCQDFTRGRSLHDAVSMEPRRSASCSPSRLSSVSSGVRIGRRSDPDDGRSHCSGFFGGARVFRCSPAWR